MLMWHVPNLYVCCDSLACLLWLDHMFWRVVVIFKHTSSCSCTMTHVYVYWVPFMCVLWGIYIRDTFSCMTWQLQTWDMTHWRVCCASSTCDVCAVPRRHVTCCHHYLSSFARVPWLIHMNESRYVYRVSFTCVPCRVHVCVMSCSRVCRDKLICATHPREWHDQVKCVPWLTNVCAMTRSHVWHDLLTFAPWLVHVRDSSCSSSRSFCDTTQWRDVFICVPCRMHKCDMTHSCVWHDPFIWVTYLNHMCAVSYAYVWMCCNSLMCVASLMHVCDMSRFYGWRDVFTRVTWLIRTCDVTDSYICTGLAHMCVFISATWHVHICDMTHAHVWRDSFVRVRGLDDTCAVFHLLVCRDSLYVDGITQCHVWCDTFTRVTWLIRMCDMSRTYMCDMSESYMCDMT